MSKLAKKMRDIRTGQYMGPSPVGLGGAGPCVAPPPAQPMSWGAACPSGMCSAEDLAQSLNRAFAGQRYGCRELPYWLRGVADADGVATIEGNALVTICPTRVIIVPEAGVSLAAEFSVFEMGNQNQIVGDPIPIGILGPNAYQTIPFVTDCMRAGLPYRLQFTGLTEADVLYVGLIGPAIG